MTDTPDAAQRAWDAATPEQREIWRDRMTARIADRAAHPLAFAKLWHSEGTSQRDTVRALLGPDIWQSFILGGNRSGKSEGGAMLDVAFAMGRDHPDVQRWAKLNGLDVSIIQRGPGMVYNGAPDSNDSRRFVRPKVQKFCPEGTKYRNWAGTGEAEATLPNGGKIVCKSVDQGRDGWQGDACHWIRFDEEPSDAAVVGEARMRLVDYSGRLCFTMTPLNGWTQLLTEHVETPTPDTLVRWLHGEDNPHIPREMLLRVLAKYGAHEQAARRRGEIVALEGRVYAEWSRELHVVPSFQIPADWLRFVGWDFGTRNPTGIVWHAHDPADDVIHAYREHYEAGRTVGWHAQRFHALCGNRWDPDLGEVIRSPTAEEIEFVCCDSAGRGERMQLAQDYDIPNVASLKGAGSVRDGINRIAARLAPDANGKPHYVVHDCCVELIKERENYRWDTTKKKGDLADAPLKKGDHLMDAERYDVTYFERSGYA